jgi:hypothetical protein
MACIWATYLELTWGVFAARALVNQMTKWAMRVLKHKICHHLAWIARRSCSSRLDHSVTSLEYHHTSPHSPTNVDRQRNDQQTIVSNTPSRGERHSSSLHLSQLNSSAQLFSEDRNLTDTQIRFKSSSKADQPLEVLLKTPDEGAPPTLPSLSTAQNHNSDNLTSKTNSGQRRSSLQGEESPLSPIRYPGSVERTVYRYHIYKLCRDRVYPFPLRWLDTSTENEDDFEHLEDNGDSEYFPSDCSNTEEEDESDDESEGGSWKTEDTGSNDDSNYASSGLRDDGVQDSSECRSSEFWDSEVDYYSSSDASKDGVSVESNDINTYDETSTR